MWKYQSFAMSLLVVVLGVAGCANRAPVPSHREMAECAQSRIHAFVEQSQQNAGQAEQELALLLESLEAYARDYKGPFRELHETARELLELYRQQAPPDRIAEQVASLKSLADSLAG